MPFSSVKKSKLPPNSLLWRRVGTSDFLDTYSVPSQVAPRDAAEIIATFPAWGRFLLRIRRWITAPFGLSNDGPDVADKVGIFPVEEETEQEVIAGFDDKHLNFRVSVLSHEGEVMLSTWVHPHNFGGRFYLAGIMPFHIMVVRDALRRVALVG